MGYRALESEQGTAMEEGRGGRTCGGQGHCSGHHPEEVRPARTQELLPKRRSREPTSDSSRVSSHRSIPAVHLAQVQGPFYNPALA